MKKVYIHPEIEIVEILVQHQMLAGSVGIDTSASPIDPSNADAPEFSDFDIFLAE